MTPAQSKEIAEIEEAIKRYNTHGWVDDEPGENSDMIEALSKAARTYLALLKAEAAGQWKFVPCIPTQTMISATENICTGFSGEFGTINDYDGPDFAEELYTAMLSKAPPFDYDI